MNKLSQTQLHRLIQRYFDAETSVAEEKQLKAYLASGKYKLTAEVEDALAVLSVPRRTESQSSRRSSVAASVKWIAAAAILVFAFVGVTEYVQLTDEQPTYYAYVGGRYVDDRDKVDRLMQSQLDDLSDLMTQSQNAIDGQLDELSEMMQQFDNN